MLIENLYTLDALEAQEAPGKYVAWLTINPAHDVFKGHFPGNPIMPGVCMMQIIKELTQQVTGLDLQMQQLSNVKFMALINPEINAKLRLELDVNETDEGLVKVKNTTSFDQTVALKLSSTYKKLAS